ncbi:DUF11 domain-containing protein [Leucobacter zeae]|nr:DUF11 domain-containing protein [Leucobacter zeae]
MHLFARKQRGSGGTARRLWRAGRTVAALALAAVIAIPALAVTAASPAYAAGGTLNLTMEAVNATVKSGEGASFRMQWTCTGSGTCDGAKIEVPVPVGVSDSAAFPDGIPLTVTSQSGVNVGAGEIPGSGTIVGTAPNRTLVWTFPATVATGTSGTISFTLAAPNSVTPNGTTIAPVGTFSATGATPVVANADESERTTVTSAVTLKVTKAKRTPTDVPYVNQQVTYAIMVGYEEQFPATTNPTIYAKNMHDVCETLGVQALQNLKVVDTLPAGAEFVNASHSGAYDPANGTITWDLGSSINDTAPYACKPYNGATNWTGTPLTVTVKYPSPAFSANPSPTAVTNSVVATANQWGEPTETLSSNSAASHALREGSAGSSVAKQPGYDWAVGNPLYRDVPSGTMSGGTGSSIYNFIGTTSESEPVRWQITDVMPCGLTSPTNAAQTDCATPAFTGLTFAADQYLPELDVAYTTNTGATGVCTIPAGTSMSDTVRRFCVGTSNSQPIALPAGQWITKFELDTPVPAFGGGRLYVYGTPTQHVPTENVDTVYNNPYLDVDRSDVHPWYVTVENCPVVNQITNQAGHVQLATPQQQTAADNGGICGYRQVMSDPFNLRPAKKMYDATLPGTPPAVPSVQTGQTLTVDLSIYRSTSQMNAGVIAQSKLTPTVTDELPENLEFVDGSLQIVAANTGAQPYVTALGAPAVEVTGTDRQKIRVTFPDANIPEGSTSMAKEVLVRFQVKVKDGTAAGTYQNSYLLTGAEGGPGIDTTYLLCGTGTMVDADLQPTSDRSKAVGCQAQAGYTVLPVPGAKALKTVQGVYDAAAVDAPGIGSTNIGGGAKYAIDILNSGSVSIRDVVAYDMLPRVGDSLTLPGASGTPRNSEFPVRLTGAVAAPQGATVQYSVATNPCRGDLAGTGGGAIGSAPAGCVNDWSAVPPLGDYSAVTAIRFDFGDRVFAAGERAQIMLDVRAAGPNVTTDAALDGVAWNNVAIVAVEHSSGRSTLPTEQTPVGLRMIPDLAWSKTDQTTGELLAGSEWRLEAKAGSEPAEVGVGASLPLAVIDCVGLPCVGADQDPAAGKFSLVGVPWGEYTLTETAAPDGYQPIAEPIAVNVAPSAVDRGTLVLDIGAVKNALIQGEWTLAKTSDPASGSTVAPGSTISYTLTASNDSAHPVTGVTVSDDLAEVLNNASFGEFTNDDGGKATRSGNDLTWNVGTLAAGETRTVTYTVTVNEDAIGVSLKNVVTGSGEVPPTECTVDEPCSTEHETPATWSLSKTSDPASGSVVAPGSTISYTLTAVNASKKAVNDVVVSDDLAEVLNNASFGEFTNDDGGKATRSGNDLTWNVGTLAAGETRTVTYTVTVNEDAIGVSLKNVVTGSGEVPPTECTVDEPCSTEHETPATWSLSKTSDPASGSVVAPGSTISYTLTAVNASKKAVNDVVVTDYLDDILDDAKFDDFVSDDGGKATHSGEIITWRVGTLQAGETRTITYRVTVNDDAFGRTLRNVVTGDAVTPPGSCTAEDPCETEHTTPPAPERPDLVTTGGDALWPLGVGGAALLLIGIGFVLNARRRAARSE